MSEHIRVSRHVMTRLCTIIVIALALAGCVTAAPRTLSLQEIRTFKVTAVETRLASEAVVAWPNLTEEYVDAKLAGQPNDPTEYPLDKMARIGLSRETVLADIRRSAETRLAAAASSALEAPLRQQLAGTRSVVAVVTVERISVPTLFGAILSGLAARISPLEEGAKSRLTAKVSFLDVRTRAVLLVYEPKFETSVEGGKPIIDLGMSGAMSAKPEERLFFIYRGPFLEWLTAA